MSATIEQLEKRVNERSLTVYNLQCEIGEANTMRAKLWGEIHRLRLQNSSLTDVLEEAQDKLSDIKST